MRYMKHLQSGQDRLTTSRGVVGETAYIGAIVACRIAVLRYGLKVEDLCDCRRVKTPNVPK
jgi:hypothetical protein